MTSDVVSATGAAGNAVTAVIPARIERRPYVTLLEIIMYATLVSLGGATPHIVTTTNLPGSLAFTFPSALAIGSAERRLLEFEPPLRCLADNVDTTIVCPTVSNVIWRVNMFYFIAGAERL